MKTLTAVLALSALAPALAACATTGAGPGTHTGTPLIATLDGKAEVPGPGDPNGTGEFSGWFDPAIDFAQIPLHLVDVALAGYRSVGPLDGDEEAEQRILWDHVVSALTELWRLRIDMNRVYHPCPTDGLVEVLALAVDGTSPLLQYFPSRRAPLAAHR